MSKARGLADLGNQIDDGAITGSNMVVNGSFQVAQRGVSFTANGYGLDRWKTFNSGGTATLSQQTFASGDSPEVGLDTYVRIVRASPSGIYYFSQKVEDVRKSDAATLTLSFYGKASSATTVPCRITQEFGSGGSSGVNITAQNNNLTTSWQRFSVTFNMASLSGKTIGTGSNFETVFDIPATTATIEITGVCLNVGDSAISFPHESYGDTLAKCERYYQRTGPTSGDPTEDLAASCYTGSRVFARFPLISTMRTGPTVTGQIMYVYSNGANRTGGAQSDTKFRDQKPDAFVIYTESAACTQGDAAALYFYAEMDAEL